MLNSTQPNQHARHAHISTLQTATEVRLKQGGTGDSSWPHSAMRASTHQRSHAAPSAAAQRGWQREVQGNMGKAAAASGLRVCMGPGLHLGM